MNQDSQFDAAFVHNPDGIVPSAENILSLPEALPLLLVGKGQFGYSKTLASAVAGSLGEGDQQDSTLGAWFTLTQRDWSGGRGENATNAVSNKFAHSTADTRYAGKLTLASRVHGPFALPSPPTNDVTFKPWVYANNMYVLCGSNAYSTALTTGAITSGEADINATWTLINSNAIYATARTLIRMTKQLYTNNYTGGGFQPLWLLTNDSGTYFADDGQFNFGSSMGGAKFGLSLGNNSHVSVSGNTATPYSYQVDPAAANPKPWNYMQQNYYTTPNAAYLHYCRFGGNNTTALAAMMFRGAATVLANDGIYTLNGFNDLGGSYTRVIDADTAGLAMPTTPITWTISPVDGNMYFGAGQDLVVFNGSTVMKLTLNYDRDLPSDISTTISCVTSSPDGVFVATGESGKRSAIFQIINGAWHCVYIAVNLTQIYSVWVDNRQFSGGATVQARLWWFEGTQAYYVFVGPNRSNWLMNAVSFNVRRKFALASEWWGSWWGGKYAATRKVIGGLSVTHEVWDVAQSSAVQADIEVDRSGVWIPLTLERVDWATHLFITTCKTWTGKTVTAVTSANSITINDTSNISAGDFCRIGDEVVQVKSLAGNTLSLARALRGVVAVGERVMSARPVGYEVRVRLRLSSTDVGLSPEITRVSLRLAYEMLRYDRYSVYVRCEDGMKTRANTDYPYSAEELREELRRWMNRPDPFWLILPDGTRSIVRGMNGNDSEFRQQQVNGVGVVAPGSVIKLVLQEVEEARG